MSEPSSVAVPLAYGSGSSSSSNHLLHQQQPHQLLQQHNYHHLHLNHHHEHHHLHQQLQQQHAHHQHHLHHHQQANLSGPESREAVVRLAAGLASLVADQSSQVASLQESTAAGGGAQQALSRLSKATLTTTTAAPATSNRQQEHALIVNDLLVQFVNLNIVRKMIAQNFVEFLIVCVIISYLIFYFCFISRRPRLVGDPKSKFVQFIRDNLRDTLSSRFNPLVYFWGTNPQTALFGYLQGNSSLDEMPRNKFKRQYIYVSDAQYLTSNVDLSQHYAQSNKRYLLQLQVDEETRLRKHQQQQPAPPIEELQEQQVSSGKFQLEQNIRLHMAMAAAAGRKEEPPADGGALMNGQREGPPAREKRLLFSAASSESSSDSGVFGGGPSSGSSASSTSSLAAPGAGAASIQEDEADEEESPHQQHQKQQQVAGDKGQPRCSCKARYKSQPTRHHPLAFAGANLLSGASGGGDAAKPGAESVRREQLEFGQCAIDWHKSSHRYYHSNKLVALISAGMTTGSDKKYVTDTVTTMKNLGYEVCVFIRRGVGGLKLSSSKFFSPAKWRDFEAAVLSIRQQRPGARVVAIGFSFGSIELCRYLSMSGRGSLVDAALLISCPFDPEAGGRNMRKRALNRKIDAYLALNLGKQLYRSIFANSSSSTNLASMAQHQHQLTNHNGSLVDLRHLPKIKSLVDFEDNFNRVIQNYPNSEAYALDSRLQDHLIHIETPTLCLSSEDDFMAPLKLLPLKQIEQNKNLCMVLTKRGGHMAFIDGLVWPKKPYFAQRIIEKFMGALRCSLPPSDDEVNTCPPEVVTEPPARAPAQHHQPAGSQKFQHLLQMFNTTNSTAGRATGAR